MKHAAKRDFFSIYLTTKACATLAAAHLFLNQHIFSELCILTSYISIITIICCKPNSVHLTLGRTS